MVSSVVVVPPSGLPAISPTRREIRWERSFRIKQALFSASVSSNGAAQPPLDLKGEAIGCLSLISPLVGEMPGRAEGGNATLLNKQGGTSC